MEGDLGRERRGSVQGRGTRPGKENVQSALQEEKVSCVWGGGSEGGRGEQSLPTSDESGMQAPVTL